MLIVKLFIFFEFKEFNKRSEELVRPCGGKNARVRYSFRP